MKIEKIEIEKYKVFRDFEIDFLDKDGKPLDLVVLAGINGSGKTSLLEYINSRNQLEETLKRTIELTTTGNLSDNIIYFQVEESQTNLPKLEKSIIQYVDELIFEKNHAPLEAYQIIEEQIKNIFENLDIRISFSHLNRKKEIFFKNNLNEEISIEELSTGEKELLNKIFFLFIADIKNLIILIDEPEISLHPSWQSRVVKIYKNFAKMNNCQIIIATHSPQIIASTPNESLRLLIKEDDKIKAISSNAYGMEFSKVLTDIMGVNELRDIEVQKKYDEVKTQILTDNYKTEKFEKDLLELEKMMENDSLDFNLLKLELLKREKQNAPN